MDCMATFFANDLIYPLFFILYRHGYNKSYKDFLFVSGEKFIMNKSVAERSMDWVMVTRAPAVT